MAGIRSTGRVTVADLQRKIASLNEPTFRRDLSQSLALAADKLVQDGFRSETNPYGKPWQPLKYRSGKALQLTGGLRASVATVALGNGFRIDVTKSYGVFHQYGTTHRPKRAARAQAVNRSGRFMSRLKAERAKGRSVGVRFIPAGEGGLIPQRQMIPMAETGGLPQKWVQVFDHETDKLVHSTLERR